MLPAVVSALHVLGFALAVGSIFLRGQGLARGDIAAALRADNAWGISSIVIVGTGVWRAFGGLEKGTTFYLANHAFHAKLGILGLIGLLELWPMVSQVRWRIAEARGEEPDTSRAATFALISRVQLALLLCVPFLAAAMARGLGMVGSG